VGLGVGGPPTPNLDASHSVVLRPLSVDRRWARALSP